MDEVTTINRTTVCRTKKLNASEVTVPLIFICRELLNALRDWEETQLAGAKVQLLQNNLIMLYRINKEIIYNIFFFQPEAPLLGKQFLTLYTDTLG
jgi:hypothetical protein